MWRALRRARARSKSSPHAGGGSQELPQQLETGRRRSVRGEDGEMDGARACPGGVAPEGTVSPGCTTVCATPGSGEGVQAAVKLVGGLLYSTCAHAGAGVYTGSTLNLQC